VKQFVVGLVAVLMAVPAFGLTVSPEPAEYQDWYGQLSARSGLLWNVDRTEWDGYATVPVLGYKAFSLELGLAMDPANDDGPKAAVLGLTYDVGSLADFGVEVSWAKYVSFHVGPYCEYDFENDELTWGVLSSALEFSFDQGNVDRQASNKRK
jgi:hypothetical protein